MRSVNLGQVFTPSFIAEFMVSQLNLVPDSEILDPCFGKGVFLNTLHDHGYRKLTGIELDSSLFKTDFSFDVTKVNADFLTLEFNKKFDGIVMNPPYVRQEEIDSLVEFGISKEKLLSFPLYSELFKKSNLYCYFILKACSLLSDNGVLVAIFPSTWYTTQNNLLELLNKNGFCIKNRFNCEGLPFGDDVLVDTDIVIFHKGKTNNPGLKKLTYSNDILIEKEKTEISKLSSEHHVSLSTIAEIKRGFSTGYNDFYFKDCLNFNFKLQKCISNPRKVKDVVTSNNCYEKFLMINKSMLKDSCLFDYIKFHEQDVLKEKTPTVIYKQVLKGEKWYLDNPSKTLAGSLIFSYIIRDKMRFVYLNEDSYVRDNFYTIFAENNSSILFALLNNSYSYYRLETCGKKYGAGLLKLQTYDLKKLLVINPDLFSDKQLNAIKDLFNKLIKGEIKIDEYIQQIDLILQQFECLDAKEIKTLLSITKKERLMNDEK